MFKKINIRAVLLCAFALITVFNTVDLIKVTSRAYQRRKLIPLSFAGNKFTGLDEFFADVQYVGYYTDKNLDDSEAAAEFAQAQYVLTPVVLDLDFQKHRYILFSCSAESVAMAKITEIGAEPLKRNQFGVILAELP